MAIAGNPNIRPKGTKAIKSQQRREKLMIELSQGSIHLISFQQTVGGSLAKVQRVTEEIDEDVEPILLPRNPVEVCVPALEDITVPAEYRPSILSSEPDQLSSSNPQTPASQQSHRRVQGLKRRSDISYSVSRAKLCKKRRLNPGQTVSNLAADMNKKDYVKHLGLSEGSKMSLHHGQSVMESRLRSLNFEVLEKTPADGSCLFHSILDQISRNQELKNFAANHWELCWKIVSEGFEKYIKTSLMEWPDG